MKLCGSRLGLALRQGRECWRIAILSQSAVVGVFLSLHNACGAPAIARCPCIQSTPVHTEDMATCLLPLQDQWRSCWTM